VSLQSSQGVVPKRLLKTPDGFGLPRKPPGLQHVWPPEPMRTNSVRLPGTACSYELWWPNMLRTRLSIRGPVFVIRLGEVSRNQSGKNAGTPEGSELHRWALVFRYGRLRSRQRW
jgi:hypothetical protein